MIDTRCPCCGDRLDQARAGRRRTVCPKESCQRQRRNLTHYARGEAKPMEPRPCRWCGRVFLPKSHFSNRRHVCYRETCIQKQREFEREDRKRKPKPQPRVVKVKPFLAEGKQPKRLQECTFYTTCLSEAAFGNGELNCEGCERYAREPRETRWNEFLEGRI